MTVSLATAVGDVRLRSPILAASGCAGYGDELAGYGDLAQLGGVVTKSLAAFPWEGNPPPRVAPAGVALINSVGLAGPGVAAWRRSEGLASLVALGATVVASLWGRTAEEFGDAAAQLRGAPVAAVEINASCPNLGEGVIFAHSPELVTALLAATADVGVPRWLKLSLGAPDLVAVARAAVAAGAAALVVANTVPGLALTAALDRPALGAGGGGVSGAPLLPLALRAIAECRAALGATPIVGVGGVSSGADAAAMLRAGADAVEVGTAIFASPRAPWRIQRELAARLARGGARSLAEWRGGHGG